MIKYISCLLLMLGMAVNGYSQHVSCLDSANHSTLGLSYPQDMQISTVYKPSEKSDHYVNGVVLTAFKGKIYAMWQSSAKDEDAPDTHVMYAVSKNEGKSWSKPMLLSKQPAGMWCASGGWIVSGDSLLAFINIAKDDYEQVKVVYRSSRNGRKWSVERPVRMADGNIMVGLFEQDPHKIGNRLIGAANFNTPENLTGKYLCPIWTDDLSGTTGWHRGKFQSLADLGKSSREIEPSWFLKGKDIVMLMRDQKSSFLKLSSVSLDCGLTWSTPVLTDIPDSRSKQCAGNLPDGRIFTIGNPIQQKKPRAPLAILLSQEGEMFDKGFLLRGLEELPDLQYEGRYKTLGYSYPKAMINNGYLWVGYSVNKEIVECVRIPVSSF